MQPTRRQPLFLVTGASCVGKSSMCEILFQKEQDYVVMESDLLWEERFNTPQDNYRAYRGLWMRVCASIAQIGKPVVLCGCAVPEQFEGLPERALFTSTHYLALVCGREQLLQRAARRGVTEPGLLEGSLAFNEWLKRNAAATAPPLTLLDTSSLSPEEAAGRAEAWIYSRLRQAQAEERKEQGKGE